MEPGRITPPGAVILDLDGTVADSQVGILACLRLTLEHYGRDAPDDELRALIGPPLGESFRSLGFDDDVLDEVVDFYRDVYDRVGVALAEPYDGVVEVLREFVRRGVHLVLATAKRVDFAERMLDDFGVRDLFAEVAGASLDGTLTSKVQIVAGVVGSVARVPGPVWMVGDRRHDVEAALAHDLTAVGALWGYGTTEELVDAGAAWLATRPSDLLDGASLLDARAREGAAP